MSTHDYLEKFSKAIAHSGFQKLPPKEKSFLQKVSSSHRFTFQEIRQVIDISADLMSWGEKPLSKYDLNHYETKDQIIAFFKRSWDNIKQSGIKYPKNPKSRPIELSIIDREKKALGLGHCPVYSPKTRCCGLLTLDAVDNCGQDCSYCSIQSFFSDNKVFFDSQFKEKLEKLQLDPTKHYHIGTGQSSDSLMWGNRSGILDALFAFARKWPNVILEFKSKSNNIDYLLENEIPPNIIVSWSLNPQTVAINEEHGCCSPAERIEAAQKIASKGALVGFHFHPMIHYQGWKEEYGLLFNALQANFTTNQVALVSFGTLTYTSAVIKKIRSRDIKSKILQIPFEEIAGKYSYPKETKIELFKYAYQSLKAWHRQVFFYLCMEGIDLWKPVFGFEFPDNDSFEETMIRSYFSKAASLKIL